VKPVPERLRTQTEKRKDITDEARKVRFISNLDQAISLLGNLLTIAEDQMKRANCIYRVKYEEQTDGTWDGGSGELDVLSNGDARKAVAKVEKHVVGRTFEWKDEEKDKMRTSKITGFRLISVNLLAEANI